MPQSIATHKALNNVAHVKRTTPRMVGDPVPPPGHPSGQVTGPFSSRDSNDESRCGCLSGLFVWFPLGIAFWATFIYLVFPK